MEMLATATNASNLDRPTHRPGRDDPNRYIVRKKNRFQARPYLGGERHHLGSFRTLAEARTARDEFLAGQRSARPKFLRTWTTKRGEVVQRIVVPVGTKHAIELIQPGSQPAVAVHKAYKVLSRHFGSAKASTMMRRK